MQMYIYAGLGRYLVLDVAGNGCGSGVNVQRLCVLLQWRMKMATYGLGGTGLISFSGYTNTLGTGQANQAGTSGAVMFNGVQQGDDRLAKMLRNGGMTGATTQLLYILLGAAPGSNATKTKAQVQGQTGAPGGLQVIETVSLVNRNTTAADLAAFQALLRRNPAPASYPADLSGNGGGGRQQFAGGW